MKIFRNVRKVPAVDEIQASKAKSIAKERIRYCTHFTLAFQHNGAYYYLDKQQDLRPWEHRYKPTRTGSCFAKLQDCSSI